MNQLYDTIVFPSASPEADKLIGLTGRLVRSLRWFQQEEAFCAGVTFNQFLILDLTAKAGRLPLRELHRTLGVDKSTTTRLVRPLIDKKLLIKEKSTTDSRAIELALTAAGGRIRLQVRDCAADFFALARDQIGEERWSRAVAGVGLFIEALNGACSSDKCCQPRSSETATEQSGE